MVLDKKNGFTLIELIVSVMIIMGMATLVLANYNSGQQEKELNLITKQLEGEIIDLKTRALAGTNIKLPDGEIVNPEFYSLVLQAHGYQVLVNNAELVKTVSWQKVDLSPAAGCQIVFLSGGSQINFSDECAVSGQTSLTINITYTPLAETKQIILNSLTGQLQN
ncbi:MAG: type II secretion system protein [Patescibacteria group bacterium]